MVKMMVGYPKVVNRNSCIANRRALASSSGEPPELGGCHKPRLTVEETLHARELFLQTRPCRRFFPGSSRFRRTVPSVQSFLVYIRYTSRMTRGTVRMRSDSMS